MCRAPYRMFCREHHGRDPCRSSRARLACRVKCCVDALICGNAEKVGGGEGLEPNQPQLLCSQNCPTVTPKSLLSYLPDVLPVLSLNMSFSFWA